MKKFLIILFVVVILIVAGYLLYKAAEKKRKASPSPRKQELYRTYVIDSYSAWAAANPWDGLKEYAKANNVSLLESAKVNATAAFDKGPLAADYQTNQWWISYWNGIMTKENLDQNGWPIVK